MKAVSMETIVNLAKRRGFIFGGSEIYGGLQGTYDYGHYGALLKENIKRAWWQANVQAKANMVALDATILMHPKVWEASGHTANFADALVDDKISKKRYRADHLIEEQLGMKVEGLSNEDLTKIFQENEIKTPDGQKADWTAVRSFNLMFKTHAGPVDDPASGRGPANGGGDDNAVYLRPETAQGIFVDFKEVQATTRKKLPFGIAQIGKSFRNEITPGKFIFRLREFEQAEIEFFCKPKDAPKWHEQWKKDRMSWYVDTLGIDKKHLRFREHEKHELSHYSMGTADIEYEFPFGWSELEGIANRGDYDLAQHQKVSGKDLAYFDDKEQQSYLPYVIEPSCGIDRIVFTVLCDAYTEEPDEKGDNRAVLKLAPSLAPVKAAVLPLMNKPELAKLAEQVRSSLAEQMMVDYDVTGSIGKRYRRQDEIGTPYCVTVDFDSLTGKDVTVRDRDSQKQERVKIAELANKLRVKLA